MPKGSSRATKMVARAPSLDSTRHPESSFAISRSASARDGLKPLNRSQRANVTSKTTIGTSNHDALTAASKWGKTMNAKAQITHHADETTPKAANTLGIYLDLNHRQLQTVEANPQNG